MFDQSKFQVFICYATLPLQLAENLDEYGYSEKY